MPQLAPAYWPRTTMWDYWTSCCEVAKPSPILLRWCRPLKLHELLAQFSCKTLPLMSYFRTPTMWAYEERRCELPQPSSVLLRSFPFLLFDSPFSVFAELLLGPSREGRALRSFSNTIHQPRLKQACNMPPKKFFKQNRSPTIVIIKSHNTSW